MHDSSYINEYIKPELLAELDSEAGFWIGRKRVGPCMKKLMKVIDRLQTHGQHEGNTHAIDSG